MRVGSRAAYVDHRYLFGGCVWCVGCVWAWQGSNGSSNKVQQTVCADCSWSECQMPDSHMWRLV